MFIVLYLLKENRHLGFWQKQLQFLMNWNAICSLNKNHMDSFFKFKFVREKKISFQSHWWENRAAYLCKCKVTFKHLLQWCSCLFLSRMMNCTSEQSRHVSSNKELHKTRSLHIALTIRIGNKTKGKIIEP